VRIEAARGLKGLPLSQAPFTNGLIWMLDMSIGLGTGKILAVLACDAHHHQRAPGALALEHVHCIGVCVADSWTGETATSLTRDTLVSIMYSEELNSGKSSATLQRTDRHGILGQKPFDFQCAL
jgi:hypothetical protein